MTTARNAPPEGVLAFTEGGDVSWWSPRPPAIAAVEISIAPGAVVEVDAAYPSQVLAWVLKAGGDIEALASAFGDVDFAQRIAEEREGGSAAMAVHPAPQLVGPWVRRALVAAVQRWTMRPIDEGALALDEATSQYKIGSPTTASRLFALASPTLMALGQSCLNGEIVGAPAEELKDIAVTAGQAVAAVGWGADILDLAAALQSVNGIDDSVLADVLSEWSLENVSVAGAGHMGGVAGTASIELSATAEVHLSSTQIDPALVPPRILDWPGADEAELTIEYRSNLDQAAIAAALAVDVDPTCLESQQLCAFAALQETGRVIATAPMQVHGRVVVAHVPCRGIAFGELQFGVYYSGTELEMIRIDRVGKLLTTVDRWMLDAWSHQRTALAAIHAVPAGGDEELIETASEIHDDYMDEAASSASTALTEIDEFLALASGVPDDEVLALQARSEVIRTYLDELRTSPSARPAELSPLLAEMLPIDPWEDE